MKYVICIPDGCADLPVPELAGRTPLEAAHTPHLDALAARAVVGRAEVIPEGMAPGSDVGNMSIFGADPSKFHTGRAPIEAAAIGLTLREDQIAFRCNLVTVTDGIMTDFTGGSPETTDAAVAIEALQDALGTDEVSFHTGIGFRHSVVTPASWLDAYIEPPHDLTNDPVVAPTGPAANKIAALMEASKEVLATTNLEATQVWLWGQGHMPVLESMPETYGISAGLVTAVDLLRGVALLSGVEIHDIDGATGECNTDYEGKRDIALEKLADGHDLFIIHVEATDMAGHAGDVAAKVKALEDWDTRILAGLIPGLDALGPWRLLMLPDHATPLTTRTHTPDPVPYLLVDSRTDGPGGVFTENGVANAPLVKGHLLLPQLLER